MKALAKSVFALMLMFGLVHTACVQVTVESSSDPVREGMLLFNDLSLSESGEFACATCHPNGGLTNNNTYVGLNVVPDGQADGRSTPLLWGASIPSSSVI